MKMAALFLVFIISFVILFVVLSLIGWVFTEYSFTTIIRDDGWQLIYTVSFGWWSAGLIAQEFDAKY